MTRSTGITLRLLARRSIPQVAELEALLLTHGTEETILLRTVAERGEPKEQQLALPACDATAVQALAATTLAKLVDPAADLASQGSVQLGCEPLSDGDELRAVWLGGEGSPFFVLVVGGPEQGRLIIVDGRYGAELVSVLGVGATALMEAGPRTLH